MESPLADERVVDAAEIRRWRDLVRAAPERPYDNLDTTPRHAQSSFWPIVEAIIRDGWSIRDSGKLSIRPPVAWAHRDRSVEFHWHAWDPLTYLLPAYDMSRERRYLDISKAFALDWIAVHQEPLSRMLLPDAIETARSYRETNAWYDMAVGQRIYRMAYLTEAMCRLDDVADDELKPLFDALLFHQELLNDPDFFVARHNHGLYQALGQLAAAKRLERIDRFAAYAPLGRKRVELMLERSFFPSGAHREHSPGYHLMILTSVLGARSGGLVSPETEKLLEMAEEVLSWMVMPTASLAPIGDTDPTPVQREGDVSQFSNDALKYVLTAGAVGVGPAPTGLRTIDDAGYVFFREPASGTYLAQTAGFHSRTHKHADHFSFVWCEAGEELLIDPGRFGYAIRSEPGSDLMKAGFWYSDPRRVYVEKTRSHNCLEIDGEDYPRSGHYGRPFGSGLRSSKLTNDGLVVTLCAGLFGRSLRHWRSLILKPGRFLVVVDWARDASEAAHDARQWFQFAPRWDVARSGTGYVGRAGDLPVRVAPLLPDMTAEEPARGRTEPMAGWRSDKANSMTPTTSVCLSQTRKPLLALATLFSLSNNLSVSPQSRGNASLSSASFRWVDDFGAASLAFSKLGDDLSVNFEG